LKINHYTLKFKVAIAKKIFYYFHFPFICYSLAAIIFLKGLVFPSIMINGSDFRAIQK